MDVCGTVCGCEYVGVNSVTVCGCNCVGQYGCMLDSIWMYVGQYVDIYGTACGCKDVWQYVDVCGTVTW